MSAWSSAQDSRMNDYAYSQLRSAKFKTGSHDIITGSTPLNNTTRYKSTSRNLPKTAASPSNVKQIKIETYKSVFQRVFHQRMKFYHRLSAIIAFIFTLIISVPFKSSSLIFFPIKFLLVWTGYYILQKSRFLTLTSEESKEKNQIMKIISIFSSEKCLILLNSFLINSFITSVIIYVQSDSSLNYYIDTPTKTIKPFVNDNFAFFCFFMFVSSLVHSVNMLISEKFIVHTKIGTYRQDPIEYLRKLPWIKTVFQSILKSVFLSFTIPLTYHLLFRNVFFKIFLKPLVFINDLNSTIPRSDFKVSLLLKLSFYSWLTSFTLDILNELFNSYALIGCLVVDKPISYLSNTPFQTLLNGIKDYENSFVRLTALQELAFLSTSLNLNDRLVFYRGNNWTLILAEIFFILTNVAKSSRYNLPKLNSNLKFNDILLKEEKSGKLRDKASIFGSLNNFKTNLDFDFDLESEIKSNGNNENIADNDITVIKDVNDDIFVIKNQSNAKEEQVKNSAKEPQLESRYNAAALVINGKFNSLIKNIKLILVNKLNINPDLLTSVSSNDDFNINLVVEKFQKHFTSLFVGNLSLESNKRIPNKEIVGFAIISLTEILIQAKTEDKSNNVISTLTESLILLTKVYKGTSEFLINPPNFVKIGDNGDESFSILVINELSISYFFKLVIYYNSLLNDLILPPEVFKLAKWCTEMALEQQKDQKLSNVL